jgi:hypothetical protein
MVVGSCDQCAGRLWVFGAFTGTGTGIAVGLGTEVTLVRNLGSNGRRVTRNSAQAFSAEVVEDRVVVLRGQGGVERPEATRTRDQSWFAARGRPALAVLARLGFLARRRQCLRTVAWPQHMEQNEDKECSAEACREPLRGRSSRLCQRGSVQKAVSQFKVPKRRRASRFLGQPLFTSSPP